MNKWVVELYIPHFGGHWMRKTFDNFSDAYELAYKTAMNHKNDGHKVYMRRKYFG